MLAVAVTGAAEEAAVAEDEVVAADVEADMTIAFGVMASTLLTRSGRSPEKNTNDSQPR